MAFWKKIFTRKKAAIEDDPLYNAEEHLGDLLKSIRSRLRKFLLTRSKATGEIKKTKYWALNRTNRGLFRLEAEGLSLMILTRPFLVEAKEEGGKIQGLMLMGEVALNEALHRSEHLSDFIAHMDPPIDPADLKIYQSLCGQQTTHQALRLPALEEFLRWQPFAQDQMIARHSVNTLAHILIHAAPRLEFGLRNRLSIRLREQIIEELESLRLPGSDPALNPHSQRRGLLEYEAALLEFRTSMRAYLLEEERKSLRVAHHKELQAHRH